MKCIILIIFVFQILTNIGYGQSTIEIHGSTLKERSGFVQIRGFKVFKGSKFIQSDSLEHHFSLRTSISNLEAGDYRIEYETLFRTTESVEITVDGKSNYEVELYLDFLDYSKVRYKTFISTLKNGKEYQLVMNSRSCLGEFVDTVRFWKSNDTVYVQDFYAKRALSKELIQEVEEFEKELTYIDKIDFPGCTSQTRYEFIGRLRRKHYKSISCEWFGWSYLEEVIDLY